MIGLEATSGNVIYNIYIYTIVSVTNIHNFHNNLDITTAIIIIVFLPVSCSIEIIS